MKLERLREELRSRWSKLHRRFYDQRERAEEAISLPMKIVWGAFSAKDRSKNLLCDIDDCQRQAEWIATVETTKRTLVSKSCQSHAKDKFHAPLFVDLL